MSLSWRNYFVAQIDFDFNTVNSVEPNLGRAMGSQFLGYSILGIFNPCGRV
jgi:hypothetical protein